jgi:hypothetical protein
VPTTEPEGTEAPANQAPGGGGLQVVDHGYTQVGGNGHVSLGALVRNTRAEAVRRAVQLKSADVNA